MDALMIAKVLSRGRLKFFVVIVTYFHENVCVEVHFY